jgi:hypothetical protein
LEALLEQLLIELLERKTAKAFTLDGATGDLAGVESYVVASGAERMSDGKCRVDVTGPVPNGEEESRHQLMPPSALSGIDGLLC